VSNLTRTSPPSTSGFSVCRHLWAGPTCELPNGPRPLFLCCGTLAFLCNPVWGLEGETSQIGPYNQMFLLCPINPFLKIQTVPFSPPLVYLQPCSFQTCVLSAVVSQMSFLFPFLAFYRTCVPSISYLFKMASSLCPLAGRVFRFPHPPPLAPQLSPCFYLSLKGAGFLRPTLNPPPAFSKPFFLFFPLGTFHPGPPRLVVPCSRHSFVCPFTSRLPSVTNPKLLFFLKQNFRRFFDLSTGGKPLFWGPLLFFFLL